MKYLFLGICILLGAIFISNAIQKPAELESKRIQVAESLNYSNEQSRIIMQLEAMQNPVVTQFAEDWRHYYNQEILSSESIAELKLIQQRIIANPDDAKNYTLEHHKRIADKFNDAISSPLGTKMSAKPGL